MKREWLSSPWRNRDVISTWDWCAVWVTNCRTNKTASGARCRPRLHQILSRLRTSLTAPQYRSAWPLQPFFRRNANFAQAVRTVDLTGNGNTVRFAVKDSYIYRVRPICDDIGLWHDKPSPCTNQSNITGHVNKTLQKDTLISSLWQKYHYTEVHYTRKRDETLSSK